MLCVFVAGLEFLSEVFVSGVDVGDLEIGGRRNGGVKGKENVQKPGVEGNRSIGGRNLAREDGVSECK